MLLNYLKLSLRHLARKPFFTAINVLGLAIGFTSFFVLWEYSTDELKTDQYHKDFNRIARIGANWEWTDDGGKTWGHLIFGFNKAALLSKLEEDRPEVESWVRIAHQPDFNSNYIYHSDQVVISIDDPTGAKRMFKEEKVVYADSNLFSFFSIPLVYGRPQNVLKNTNDVVLSQSTAGKYFGKTNPVGELLRINDTLVLKVSGVYEDLPHYSHLEFSMVVSNTGLLNKWNEGPWSVVMSYVKLRNTGVEDFEKTLNQDVDKYWAEELRESPQSKVTLFVQPLADIAFSQNFVGDFFHPKSRTFLLTLAFIAISVLVMAWINYINLSVTRTTRRFKEIATRKVSGAGAGDMVRQFIVESLVTNVLALALAATIIQLARGPVSILFNISIASFTSLNINSIVILVTIVTTGILVSGLYPALISMTYQPRALISLSSQGYGKRIIPSILTVSQLTAAIIFILMGFVVSLQLDYVLSTNAGFKKEQTIIVEAPILKPLDYSTRVATLKKEILGNKGVLFVTNSHFMVDYVGTYVSTRRIGSSLYFGSDGNFVDEDFIAFYGLNLLVGRNFSMDDQAEGVIISRYAAERLGFDTPQKALGAKIGVTVIDSNWKSLEVLGVIENFRNWSLLNITESSSESLTGRGIVLLYKDKVFGESVSKPEKFSIRISQTNFVEAIVSIQRLYEQQFPGNLFNWYFLDEKTSEVYAHEKVARNQIVLFTVLALFIACLGLLGMITNKVVEKTKEIGIRKVLGARLHQIAHVLLNTTASQIAVATLIGIPVAYYLIQQYLNKFLERITLEWWHFSLPVLILIFIMLSTIASVLWRAARGNPVDALKYE